MIETLLINGPNLNMLGVRERSIYGVGTLAELEQHCKNWASANNQTLKCFQSNFEGEIVTAIQGFLSTDKPHNSKAIIINAGAYTHTSIAIADAILAVGIDAYEVHISNVYKRESFRQNSYLSNVCVGVVSGFGRLGYKVAIEAIATKKIDD